MHTETYMHTEAHANIIYERQDLIEMYIEYLAQLQKRSKSQSILYFQNLSTQLRLVISHTTTHAWLQILSIWTSICKGE
jgi:hypothetical protein